MRAMSWVRSHAHAHAEPQFTLLYDFTKPGGAGILLGACGIVIGFVALQTGPVDVRWHTSHEGVVLIFGALLVWSLFVGVLTIRKESNTAKNVEVIPDP